MGRGLTVDASTGSASPARTLAGEQAALRRIATLVARNATPAEVFAVVAEEVSSLLDGMLIESVRCEAGRDVTSVGVWGEHPFELGDRWTLDGPSVIGAVLDSNAPARIDDYSELPGNIAALVREAGIRSVVGAPVVVEGRTWGVITACRRGPDVLPPETEARLAGFTELVAPAISSTEARDRLRRLADEQAALRRVATLVARQASPAEVFAAVAEEVCETLSLPLVVMGSYEPDDVLAIFAAAGAHEPFRVGARMPLDPGVSLRVRETGRPAKVDYGELPGVIADTARQGGFRVGLGVPIVVDGAIWGCIATASTDTQQLPDDAETWFTGFVELIAIAISNAEARDDLQRLADEQAALRRVATLVAEGARPDEVFAAVAHEVGDLIGVPAISMVRFELDETSTAIAVWGDENPFGVGATFEPWPGVMLTVRRTGRPARLEDFADSTGPTTARLQAARIHSGFGVPINVEGRVWGTIIALATGGASLPAGIEERLSSFTELVATAIANTQARDDVRRLADEQAALRRVATLVAQGVEPRAV